VLFEHSLSIINKSEKMKRIQLSIFSALLLLIATTDIQAQNTLDFTPQPWSVRLFGSPLITNNTSNTYPSEEKTALGFNFGGDLVYTFFQKGKWSLNTSLGLGLTKYNSLRKVDFKNELWTSEFEQIKNANQTFKLTETATNIEEHQNFLFLDIPVKLGVDYAITSKLSAYATVGLTYGLNLSSKYTSTANLTRTGFYPDYNVLLFDIDIAGSPYYYPTNKPVSGSGSIGKQNNFSVEGSLGAKYKLNPKVSLFAGAKLMHGFANVKTNPAEFIMATSSTSLNSLANRSDKLQTRAIGLEVGVQLALNCVTKPKFTALTGTITDGKTVAPLSALLLIKNNGEVVNTIMTDKDGNYSVNLPSGKTYELEASATDHTTQNQMLDFMKSGKTAKQDFALMPIVKPVVVPDTVPSKPVVKTAEVVPPPAPKVVELKFQNIQFKTGTADLTTESIAILDLGYNVLIENPTLQIEIVGHTDNNGNEAANLELSKKRANTVMTYLLNKGVKSNQMKAYGLGQTKPIATNETEVGKAQNRRVEFIVSKF
jgi:outer membrane protein OmpA-like peptidoglycan-associated protein/opacity protein-like surface antigen